MSGAQAEIEEFEAKFEEAELLVEQMRSDESAAAAQTQKAALSVKSAQVPITPHPSLEERSVPSNRLPHFLVVFLQTSQPILNLHTMCVSID